MIAHGGGALRIKWIRGQVEGLRYARSPAYVTRSANLVYDFSYPSFEIGSLLELFPHASPLGIPVAHAVRERKVLPPPNSSTDRSPTARGHCSQSPSPATELQ
jgi:hypothetical protein